MAGFLDRLTSALAERYTIDRELGRGGMATVYLATDRRHGRQVALKVLEPELARAIGPERFQQEIQIAARLTHPNILPLHDSGEADGLLYYVMPFVPGESLRDRLGRDRQLSLDETVAIIGSVAAAWDMPTARASSTGTSSRRTSCCPRDRRCWPISGSPARSTPPAASGSRPQASP
jgi:eukaryotic-like serine/threonine-protein kinase